MDAQRARFEARDLMAGSRDEHQFIDRCLDARAAIHHVGIRPFGPAVMQTSDACVVEQDSSRAVRTPLVLTLRYNSARAVPAPGVTWFGRGLTTALSGGMAGSWRSVRWAARPVVFWSQDRDYRPIRNANPRPGNYSDPWGNSIDLPYQWKAGAMHRLDPGESYVRVDSRWVSVGLSSASQVWGPARIHPLVMGNNAGGFPHAFVETPGPVSIGLGSLSVRWVAGRIEGSAEARSRPGYHRRTGVGTVVSFTPAGMPGLEIGGSRFFHVYDSSGTTLSVLTLPFSGLLKALPGDAGEETQYGYNQVAELFARVAPAGSPLELYGAIYREDHALDFRDIMAEPDHSSALLLGLSYAWTAPGRRGAAFRTLTVETANGRISHLARVRAQGPPYVHGVIREGHTLRGQTLGAPAVYGGGGLTIHWSSTREDGQGWEAVAEVARHAQDGAGGTWRGETTGAYTLSLTRHTMVAGRPLTFDVGLQPGFGYVAGTNVVAGARFTAP